MPDSKELAKVRNEMVDRLKDIGFLSYAKQLESISDKQLFSMLFLSVSNYFDNPDRYHNDLYEMTEVYCDLDHNEKSLLREYQDEVLSYVLRIKKIVCCA